MTTGKKILIGCAIALGVFVVGIAAIIALALFSTKGLPEVANQQLTALRSGDMAKAYSYTSKDFQNTTSLDKFKEFVDSYPSLKNNESSSFSNRKIENDQGTLEGTLKAKDGGVTPIIYHFVKENNDWKILNMQLKPTGTEAKGQETASTTAKSASTTTNIIDIKLNDKIGKDGYVDTHKSEFTAQTAEIQASAYIKNAKKGDTVQAILVYIKTGDQVGPASNTIENDGDVISNFSFTKPTKGWPTGDYQVAVKVASEQIKAVDFTVK